MIPFPQINFQKQMVAIGFNVKISGAWRFSAKMANGNLSLTTKNCLTLSIFMRVYESICNTVNIEFSLMKKLLTLVTLLSWSILQLSAQVDNTANAKDNGQSISNVLVERLTARLNSAHIVIDDGRIVSAQLHNGRYVKLIEQIDTTGCPQEFRLAWLNYVQTWERKSNPRDTAENVLESLPAFHGDVNALTDVAKRIEADDTLISWQKCERIALEFGADPSKLEIR
jgi:hypothetical protein